MFQYVLSAFKAFYYWLFENVGTLVNVIGYEIFNVWLLILEFMIKMVALPAEIVTKGMVWADLPPQVLWVVNKVSIPEGLSIIFAAITVRVLLNLIPAALTRI